MQRSHSGEHALEANSARLKAASTKASEIRLTWQALARALLDLVT